MISVKNNQDTPVYRLEWKTFRKEWPIWLLMLGILILAIYIYPHLPEKVPTHWNLQGQVNQYSSRSFGAFFAPLLNISLYLLLLVTPLIDPKRNNYIRFAGAYTLFRWALVLFMSGLYVVTILVALGHPVNIGLLVKGAVAVLFILIGNMLGQLRFNYFVGIRTPWTLANEAVWRLTHRLGSRIWVAGGLVCLAAAFINAPWGSYIFFGALAVIVLVPVVYSYLVFARINQG